MILNICPASEYFGKETKGFVIEALGFFQGDKETFAIPAWEEQGLSDFIGVFETKEQAIAVIEANGFKCDFKA